MLMSPVLRLLVICVSLRDVPVRGWKIPKSTPKFADRDSSYCRISLTQAVSGCPHGFELYGDTCFFFSNGEATWIDSFLSCKLFKSQLVEITNVAIDEYLRNRTSAIGDKRYYWISLTDKLIEGEFIWETSKTQLSGNSYSNWGAGEPDFGDENCVLLAPSRNYSWADATCTRTEHYICEKPVTL